MMTEKNNTYNLYDVIIIGAGASGSSLLYTLSRYTNIEKIALIEKYHEAGSVNSKSSNNSQTLHVGDIETNYSLEKVREVNEASMMIPRYAQSLTEEERKSFLFFTQKMVLGVGADEIAFLEKRFKDISPIFPDLRKLNKADIALVEPALVKGREEEIVALYTDKSYAVDFQSLAKSFIKEAKKVKPKTETFFDTTIETIVKSEDTTYTLSAKDGKVFKTKVLIVNADAYSLYFAKSLGYGKEFSLIPVAGNFYFSHEILKGKVYTIQDPSLPFAAVHGDPDVRVANATRWGPTARIFPVLESGNISTMLDYFQSAGLFRIRTIISFAIILSDRKKLVYLLKNGLYELPFIGIRLFAKSVQKIVPTIRASQLSKAKGYGGMRLQRVDTVTGEMKLGEGKIIGDNSIFNMTPSPGASVSLYNALRDTERIIDFFHGSYVFDKSLMEKELGCDEVLAKRESVSLSSSYAA